MLGVPLFDASAPRERIIGRKISNFWANVETLFAGIGDLLFGMRVYPLAPLLEVMEASRFMRGFDFDTETVVRLSWRGMPALSVPAAVRYFRIEEGGVSHYRYGRDNVLLVGMHLRLLAGVVLRLPDRRVRPHRPELDGGVDLLLIEQLPLGDDLVQPPGDGPEQVGTILLAGPPDLLEVDVHHQVQRPGPPKLVQQRGLPHLPQAVDPGVAAVVDVGADLPKLQLTPVEVPA